MTNTSKYLNVLAKIMRNKNTIDSGIDKEKYNKLYYMIHSELNIQLQKSSYPFTSDIVQKCEDMLDAMEPLYICSELVRKKCVLISNYITTEVFSVCNSLFKNHDMATFFRKIYTQIPFIIVNTDSDSTIEVLNYANVRISLTESEFKYLVIESGKRKIALNKVIQYVLVRTELNDSELSIISDNIYGNAEKMFFRAVSKRIAHVNDDGVKNIGKRHLNSFDALVMSENVKEKILSNSLIRKHRAITYSEIAGYIANNVNPILYGFYDEFLSIETQITDYYKKQEINAKTTLQDVVGDIVRLGDSGDQTLQSIRNYEEAREKKIKSESKEISTILKDIETLVSVICTDLGENYITDKQISRYVLDDIFESIFRCENFSSGLGKKLLSRLYSFEYDNYDLVSTYIQIISGKKATFDAIEIEKFEWEKAKMLIYILPLEKIPEYYLNLYVETLGMRCSNGKELYAKALVSTGKDNRILLQESFDKGYEKAGLTLLEMYKKGDRNVNLLSLANALVPEACMIVANQKMGKYQNRRRFADLSDNEFTYYKIAAAKQYLPAIGQIVDIVFESRFLSGFQIPKDDLKNEKYEEMIDNGHVICQLCQFLINKMYQVNHYSETLGIVLFCLNENLSGAMSLLTKADSSLALYCKGNMFEFGGGVAIDLDQAIENYANAIRKGFSGRAEKRLAACNGKKARYVQQQKNDDFYQSERSYHSSSTRTGSSTVDDGCFAPGTRILMADGSYCFVEDVKRGDSVIAFNHYSGCICEAKVIANVHNGSEKKRFDVIMMYFDNHSKLEIVKSHVLFDKTENHYVMINKINVGNYIDHEFITYKDGEIQKAKLIDYCVEKRETYYYVPISKMHLNIFAENLLTMPPTKLTVNMFSILEGLRYDTSITEKVGFTQYSNISNIVSITEYEELPCKYLAGVMTLNNCTENEFIEIVNLYRQ